MPLLLQENRKTPVAYVGGASFLSQSFIGIPRKPSYLASFSPLNSPTTLFIPNLILYQSINKFFSRQRHPPFEFPGSLGIRGPPAGPWHRTPRSLS